MAENTERRKIRYRLRVPVKGVFYDAGRPDWKIPLTEDQLTYFEQPIQYSLHNTEDIRPAPDHGRLSDSFPERNSKKRSIQKRSLFYGKMEFCMAVLRSGQTGS